MTALLECYEFSVPYNHSMYSKFKIKLYMLIASHYIDTFKLDAYVSQLYFNAINKVARYTV